MNSHRFLDNMAMSRYGYHEKDEEYDISRDPQAKF
jgi:hypothetical protein